MTLREIRLLVTLILIAILALGFRLWLNNRDANIRNAQLVDQAARTGKAAVDIAERSTEANLDVRANETRVITERIIIQQSQEALRNENPDVMHWSNGVIPVELRDADRKARIAAKRPSDI